VLIDLNLALSFFFVHPAYQRQGVGSLLLQVGIKRADEQQAKIWLTSTPQAVPAYQKSGWEVKEIYTLDLGKHGGTGTYNRAWMVRPPRQTIHEMA
jgi:GNAT superfamily N-acetyltransferase